MLKELGGIPAHPAYVHFPIAFLVLSGLLLLIRGLDGGSQRLNRIFKKLGLGTFDFDSFSLLALLLGFLTGLLAVASGLALVEGWKNIPFPHAPLGMAGLVTYFVALVVRWVYGPSLYGRKQMKLFYYALHLAGLSLILFAGFEGGKLHYG